MFTAIILANTDAKAMTRTLNALIGATVSGLVRDVILLADIQNEIAGKIADFSGCKLASPGDFAEIVLAAKTDWLLLLEAGCLPEEGWDESVENFAANARAAARFTRSPLAPRTLLSRLFHAEKPLALGLVVEKSHAVQLLRQTNPTPYHLAKAAKPVVLSAKLRPASGVHPNAA